MVITACNSVPVQSIKTAFECCGIKENGKEVEITKLNQIFQKILENEHGLVIAAEEEEFNIKAGDDVIADEDEELIEEENNITVSEESDNNDCVSIHDSCDE